MGVGTSLFLIAAGAVLDFGITVQDTGGAWSWFNLNTIGLILMLVGIVGLTNVDRVFGTARIWVVVGDKTFGARGHATHAASRLLSYAFRELKLRAVNTWIVEHNPSRRIAERLNFTLVGRQRQCHVIDGRPYDRLWFDILASEHKET